MSDKTCSTCKHWYVSGDAWRKPFGACDVIPHISSHDSELAYIQDHDESMGALYTHPTFGCVLHEPKEDDDE